MSRAAPQNRLTQIGLATDALNAGDFDALAIVFHPELEHHSAFGAVEGEVYRGIDGQRKRWDNVTATWDGFGIEVVQVHDVDDERVVVVLRLMGEAKASRLPLDSYLAQVWTWRDGLVWRIVTYTNPRDALEAVGLEP